MSKHNEVEDGMGFSGLVPTAAELREERERKELNTELARLRALLAQAEVRETAWQQECSTLNFRLGAVLFNLSTARMSEWKTIETAPKSGQFLVTEWEPEDGPGYSSIELVQAPFRANGEILNVNSGNYTRPGVWKWWMPCPPLPRRPSED